MGSTRRLKAIPLFSSPKSAPTSIFRFHRDIAYSTMDRKKLDNLWAAIKAARRSPQKASDLEALAKMAERTQHSGGNHPMWASAFRQHRAFPIERHGGNPDLSPHVRKVVLNHWEADAAAWEELISLQKGANE
jgi:hypothetical protein